MIGGSRFRFAGRNPGPDLPAAGRLAVAALLHPAAQQNFAPHLPYARGARLPHHAGTQSRVAKRIDQSFDQLGLVPPASFGQQPILDRRCQRQTLDALGGPIGGNLLAAHAPHFFGVGLEKDSKEPRSKLVRDPVFEGLGMANGKELRPQV